MINPETEKQKSGPRQFEISGEQLNAVQFGLALVALIIAAIFLLPKSESWQVKVILAAFLALPASAGAGWLLARRGKLIPGLGLTIYGFLFSMLTISILVERVGLFSGLLMIFMAILFVSTGLPSRRSIGAIAAGVILGSGSLLIDLYTRGADYRLVITDQVESTLGLVTIFLLIGMTVPIFLQFRSFSLRVKLIAAFLISSLVTLAVLGYFNNRSTRQLMIEDANQSLYNAAVLSEVSLHQFIKHNTQTVQTEANLPIFVDYLSLPESEQLLQANMVLETMRTLADRQSGNVTSYALLDLEGNVLIDTDPEQTGSNEAKMITFTEPIEKGTAVMSPVMIDSFTNQPSIYFSSPVVENGATILGVLRIRFQADILQELISANNDRAGEGSFAVLFDENLIHLAHGTAPETIFTTVTPLSAAKFDALIAAGRLPDKTAEETFLDLPELGENLNATLASSSGVNFFQATDVATGDLTNRVVALDMGQPNWLLVFFQPEQIFLAPNQTLQKNTVTISLISLAGALVLAVILTQIIVRPITELKETADQLASGDFEARAAISTQDEIGGLAQSFNAMSQQLQNLVSSLESQVLSRTKELENRAAQLQALSEVARDVTSEQDLQDMLNRASALIHDRFGYYHVGIYLKDDKGETAVLTASTDDQGVKLLESAHQVSINPESNVGYACILGEPIVADNQGSERDLDFHPLLTISQSQMVIPLNRGSQTLGVLDCHSPNPSAFTQKEETLFLGLADQLAIAIEKAAVQGEIRATLEELETAYGSFTQSSWQRFIQTRQNVSGYRYDQRKKVEEITHPPEEVIQAWEQGEAVNVKKKAAGSNIESTTLAIPLKVRGSVIGVLDVAFETDAVPVDTTALIEEISERLSLILENARLIETAQRQVERERLTSQISNSIRQSLDLDVVLRTAVQEIGQKLGLAEVELRLGDQMQARLEAAKAPNGNTPKPSEEAA